MKAYDRAYYDKWYRHPRQRVVTAASLLRKVHMAVGVTEFLLGRKIRTVLDVGCGEAIWFPILRRMRPGVKYTGVEASEYALQRYGKTRNIRRGTFGTLDKLRLAGDVDLVICADMLQYVETRDLQRGLKSIKRLLGGVVYLEAYTAEDDMIGDRDGWIDRSAAEYRELFSAAGFTQCGPYCFTNLQENSFLNAFEHC